MKKLVFTLFICVLLQSCHSYKKINHTNYEFKTNENYKVTLKDSKKIKGKIIESSENDITITSRTEEKPMKILKTDINKIGKKKFSILKTGGTLYVAILAAAGIGIAIILGSL
tara:strand:- start:4148 stop:4486 length:339 start_codon:yes stop_codon:yes gene_type:complete